MWPLAITELPEVGGKVTPVPTPARIIALDEGGVSVGSAAFAKLIESWRDSGIREARFLIGAADGFAQKTGDVLVVPKVIIEFGIS